MNDRRVTARDEDLTEAIRLAVRLLSSCADVHHFEWNREQNGTRMMVFYPRAFLSFSARIFDGLMSGYVKNVARE